MHIEDLAPRHLKEIKPQPGQEESPQVVNPDWDLWYKASVWKGAAGWAGIADDGSVFGATGLVPVDDYGRHWAWTLFTDDVGYRNLFFFAKRIRHFFRHGDFRRVEAISLADSKKELRWLEHALGMSFEGVLRAWTINGEDCHLYSRIKGDDPEDTWVRQQQS